MKSAFGCSLIAALLCATALPGIAAQGCRPDITATTPTSQFVNNGDGTITDTLTKLTWKQCSEGQSGGKCETGSATTLTWAEARKTAADSTFAGKKDWRLPTIKELATIVEYQCTMPAINMTVFPAIPTMNYWSSSLYAGYSEGAWNLNFNDGVHDNANMRYGLYVRLVRSGR